MKDYQNILEASELLPDFMGFIFWKPSSRYFEGVIPEIPKSIQKVGVFVDSDLAEVSAEISRHQLNVIQLHGNETPEFCMEIQKENIEIIKVFSIGNDFDFELIKPFEGVCNYFLFDTKGKLPGGNGTAFNWEILQNYPSEKPIFLSGGIGTDDIPKIKKLNFPVYGIDVNSKFETQPGLKNIALLQQFKSQLP